MTSVRIPRGASTAGTHDRNIHGQAVALTVFSTVKWWGRVELALFFLYIRSRRGSLRTLKKLSFIHGARWALVRRIPYNAHPQQRRRLHYPHLFFESNFNGGWEEYIDAFSYTLRAGMFGFWGSSYGFPSALPAGPFKEYIRRNEIVASHYYSAYPEATATMILSALEIAPHVDALKARARSMSAEEFAVAWRRLLEENQGCV